MTRFLEEQEEKGRQGIRRKWVLVGAGILLVACPIAIVVPVALSRTSNNSNHRTTGENEEKALLIRRHLIADPDSDVSSHLSDDLISLSDQHAEEVEFTDDNLLRDGNTTEPVDNATVAPNNAIPAASAAASSVEVSETIIKTPASSNLSAAAPTNSPSSPPTFPVVKTVDSFEVLAVVPHDVSSFTQGLCFDPNNHSLLYSSSGLYGESDVRKVDLHSGEVLLQYDTPREIFGEGLAFYYNTTKTMTGEQQQQENDLEGLLIHITWQSQRGFIFKADTLELIEEFQFSTTNNQGWGITHNKNTDQFIVTDGTDMLHFWDRADLKETHRVPVRMRLSENDYQAIRNLNEIEWDPLTNTILANVWQTDWILRIDPVTGAVLTRYDMQELYTNRIPQADVLNGIALSPNNDLWVTGKKWPHMYKIRMNE